MKKVIRLFLISVIAFSAFKANAAEYKNFFKDKTMRVDYFHSGTATEEHFAIDRIVSDGAWAGSLYHLVDEVNFGLYQFDVLNPEDGTIIYSRGFASVFGEWQSIPEASQQWGTFHESIRFPWPLKPVKIQMKKRNEKNNFTVIWETNIDPDSRKVTPADLISPYKTKDFLVNGSPKEKVDIVILGDGYTADEMDKFHKDIERLTASLFAVEPFKSRKNDFNIRAVETPSATSGVSCPKIGLH